MSSFFDLSLVLVCSLSCRETSFGFWSAFACLGVIAVVRGAASEILGLADAAEARTAVCGEGADVIVARPVTSAETLLAEAGSCDGS